MSTILNPTVLSWLFEGDLENTNIFQTNRMFFCDQSAARRCNFLWQSLIVAFLLY